MFSTCFLKSAENLRDNGGRFLRGSKLARKTIFFSRLRRNIELIRDLLGKKKLVFVVKSDAYGHGIEEVSAYVNENDLVDYLAVASLAEARAIREAGVELPVLMLTPPPRDQLKSLVSLNLELTVDSLQVAREADKIAGDQQETLSLHVPVDTGMGRFGVFLDEVVNFFSQLAKLDNLRIVGVYSHCSSAYSQEGEDKRFTEGQITTFRRCLEKLEKENLLPPLRHIANSGAYKGFRKQVTKSPLNMVRLGSLVYGCFQALPEWGESVIQ